MPKARVLLLGDAHRLAYQSRVADNLAPDGITTVFPPGSTGNCSALAAAVGELINQFQPDITCFASSPIATEDFPLIGDSRQPAGFAQYEIDLTRTAHILRRFCGRQVVFITTLPIHQDRFAETHGGPDSVAAARELDALLTQSNYLAQTLLAGMNIMVTRVDQPVSQHMDEWLGDDGIGLTRIGAERVADLVATGIFGVV